MTISIYLAIGAALWAFGFAALSYFRGTPERLTMLQMGGTFACFSLFWPVAIAIIVSERMHPGTIQWIRDRLGVKR